MSYDVEGAWLYRINKYARESIKGMTYDQLAKKYVELVTEIAIHRREVDFHFKKVEEITEYTKGN